MLFDVSIAGKVHRLELNRAENRWQCRVDGGEISIDAELVHPDTLSILVRGHSFEVRREAEDKIVLRGKRYEVSVVDPRSWHGRRRAGSGTQGPQRLTASMPGKIVRVLASEGEKISPGQGIAVIEAMKMQNEIKSPKQGTLKKLLVQPGMNVNAGEVLAVVE